MLADIFNNLPGTSVVEFSEKVKALQNQGEKICNLTVGDLNPQYFTIPEGLEKEIIQAFQAKKTNYCQLGGNKNLLFELARYEKDYFNLDYDPSEIVTGTGGRPLIYSFYKTVLNKGEKVINFVPSWNNHNFIYFSDAIEIKIEGREENDFLPDVEKLKEHISDASLIVLNSPLNPTGAILPRELLRNIFTLVVEENKKRRTLHKKELYVFLDAIYHELNFLGNEKGNFVALNPEIRPYLAILDGLTKNFAATGVRLGWMLGPKHVISGMKTFLSHFGAWAATPIQEGLANFLKNRVGLDQYFVQFREKLYARLEMLYQGIMALKKQGFPVDAKKPEGAFYLAIKFAFPGKTDLEIFNFILKKAGVAFIPFKVFGMEHASHWFRASIGSVSLEEIHDVLTNLERLLKSYF